jgi:putative ABC transport system permease protein
MTSILQDLKYSLRVLIKNPSFTIMASLTLALGVGANTTVFGLINAVLLRPLPYNDPDKIITIWSAFPQAGIKKFGTAYKNLTDWKEQNHLFAPLGIYQAASNTSLNLTGLSGPIRVQAARATGDFFQVLNVRPVMGRTVSIEDEHPGSDHVAVIGYNLWRQDFGGDVHLIGRTVKLNDEDYTIVGIMPPGFEFPSGLEMPAGQQFASATELWVPLLTPTGAALNDRLANSYRAVGRLKPDVSVQQAQSEMSAITHRLVAEHPNELQGWDVMISTMHENQVGELRPALLLLLGAVGFVLLIACANIANLLLSRGVVRRREFVVRAALGASRRRILQQLLMDCLVLAAIGGTLGIGLALIANRVLIALGPANIPRLHEVSIDLRVLAFTIVVSTLTGGIFGLAPALHVSKTNLQESMRDGGRSVAGSSQNWLRALLVIAEVMLVFVLLVASGLTLRSFRRLLDVPPGFDVHNVLTARVTLPARPYPGQKKVAFYSQLLDGLNRQNGIESAAIIRDLPFSGTDPRYGYVVEGRSVESQNGGVTFRYRVISADYFKVMGIPLRAGRFFNVHDDGDSPPAVIINETAARQSWPNQNPIGQVISVVGGPVAAPHCIVVGVVGDIKFAGLDSQPDVELFFPYAQIPEQMLSAVIGSMAVVVQTTRNPESQLPVVRQQVSAIDKEIPVSSVASMSELQSRSTANRRFQMLLLGVFGIVALSLAVVGIYGVTAYWVVHRTWEIGIRIALGARGFDVLYIIAGKGMLLALCGILLGLAGSFAVTRLMTSLLYEIKATDPLTLLAVALLLGATAFAACCIPAWRAMRISPVQAFRDVR